jgi:hypothetical protein
MSLLLALFLAAAPLQPAARAADLVPDCAHPGPTRKLACAQAGQIVSQPPEKAVAAFLAAWSADGFGVRAVVTADGRHLWPVGTVAPEPEDDGGRDVYVPALFAPVTRESVEVDAAVAGIELLSLIGAGVEHQVTEKSEHAQHEIVLAAIRARLSADGGPYATRMLGVLEGVRWRDRDSFETVLAAQADALGTTVGEMTTAPPPVPDADYVPAGTAPIPFQFRGRWIVVEPGQKVRARSKAAGTVEGRITALSTRGIAIETPAGRVVVLTKDLEDLVRF